MDRYQAIIHPLAKKQSKNTARVVILCIWLAGGLTALPMGAAHTFEQVLDSEHGGLKPFCSVRWSSIQVNHPVKDPAEMLFAVYQGYCVLLVILEYLVPLSIITMAYLRMGMRLWWARTPGQANQLRDDKILKNKKKVLHMLVVVVVAFAICWAPWQTYFLAAIVYPPVNHWRFINIMFFIFHWLAMSNSCYNPFIYGIYSEKFKREFRLRVSCCCVAGQAIISPNESDFELQERSGSISSRRTSQKCGRVTMTKPVPDLFQLQYASSR